MNSTGTELIIHPSALAKEGQRFRRVRREERALPKPGEEGAPTGIIGTHRYKADGSSKVDHYWKASATKIGKAALRAGWQIKTVRLLGTDAENKKRAEALQKEVTVWVYGEVTPGAAVRFTGTFGSLIRVYRASDESGYKQLKYNSRDNYDYFLDMLTELYGRHQLAWFTRKNMFAMHVRLKQPDHKGGERLPFAARAMGFVRIIMKFGIGLDEGAKKALEILATMRFEGGADPRQFLTLAHVKAFIASAHTLGFPSMAIAQAIQYETALRQKDNIGEWWPERRGPNVVEVWGSGLIWGQHISPDFILAKPTSKSRFKKFAIADLNLCELVMREFRKIDPVKMVGPVIVDESTGLPYKAASFRARWRTIARRAGIPEDHCNCHSRAGAITEGGEAGVDIELLRRFATHSQVEMTRHYNRDSLVKARTVQRQRNKHRAQGDQSRFDCGPIIDA